VLWLKWIDDKLCIANPERVQTEKEEIKKHFQCDDVGAVKDYIGCKTEINTEEQYVEFTQPVLVQSLGNEFEVIPQGASPMTPAKPGTILTKCEESNKLDDKQHSRY
jgi:hypothetical protein